ncbi:MAG: N-acetylneuraminate synthase family protein [Candidatus Marinimicrobia bacterium]|nr:N-acetylneuraminate synthase family protein [Candidatus Neomarinimicrobiota bacterium]MBL7023394.1 N-acetylneuraminate synthase family protein [Candidatus Neomarinimicrobiota bacterium]MBL7109725.1 N-acetylneuraminate synthase family protein [Candidatus Neomarinimicrobiota bacterium]
MKSINIDGRKVGSNYPTFIIAEIGINHQGDVEVAKQLIQEAKNCGADAVKFQKRTISRILTKEGLEMPYANRNSFGKTYGEHKKALELTEEDYFDLLEYSENLDVFFCASGWDEESVDFLDKMGVSFFKMASADLTNFPLLEHTAKIGKPILLSTGMADLAMVKNAVELIEQFNDQIAILQCTSTYPSIFDEINLNVLQTYKKEFPNAVIGYSGHELGIVIPPVAVGLGARIIERHFTLDRTMKGGDHAASLEPQGFAKMVRDIRHIEQAMGSDEKNVQESELPIFKKLAKSIVSTVDIQKGTKITRDMLTTKGPGTGLSPMRMGEVIGKATLKEIATDTVINENDIDWSE